MKREVKEHDMWKKHKELKMDSLGIPNIIGQYHYNLYSKKGVISMIEMKMDIMNPDVSSWEIRCVKGNLFEDNERYNTRFEAEDRCFELLG